MIIACTNTGRETTLLVNARERPVLIDLVSTREIYVERPLSPASASEVLINRGRSRAGRSRDRPALLAIAGDILRGAHGRP